MFSLGLIFIIFWRLKFLFYALDWKNFFNSQIAPKFTIKNIYSIINYRKEYFMWKDFQWYEKVTFIGFILLMIAVSIGVVGIFISFFVISVINGMWVECISCGVTIFWFVCFYITMRNN